MSSFSYSPFPRLPPVGSRLSPILEEDEKFEKTQSNKTEVNNSSQDAFEQYFIPSILSSDRISHKERNLIESSSGRRVEAVEILKQKYINNDIQDLPRQTSSPVRYGMCYRSRSSKFLFGSQDIRNQINKFTRLHSVTLGLDSTVDKEINNSYRCRKYEPILTDNDMSDDDTIDQDDYEQELLALIDKTDEDGPDKGRKGEHLKTDGAKQTPKGEALPSDNLTERRFNDYDLNEETTEAFWRGFLQGLKRSERAANEMYNKYTDMIDCKALMGEASTDPLLDAGSYLKMIENNQNITHRFLSAWENENRTATAADMGMIGAAHSNTDINSNIRVSCNSNSECISRATSEPKPSPVNNFGEISKSEEKSTKTNVRSLLVMSKTDIHFDNSLPNTGDSEAAPAAKQRPKPKTPKKLEGIWKVHQNSISDTTENRDLDTPELGTMKVILTPKQKEDIRSKSSILHVDSAEDDVNVFQLAQRRIQSSGSSGMYQILPTKPKSTQKKDQAAKVSDDLFAFDEFDGWSTKPFTVQDNLRLSCSEILHPVDSSERFELPNHNTNTNDGISKDLLSLEKTNVRDTMTPRNQSQSADGLLKSTNKATPHNSPFLGHETLDPNGRTFETNAFKANGHKNKQNPFLADIKNTSDLVRLRLTKSSCSSPNSNRNMPISRSRSLTLQKKFISDLSVTNSIDLSNSLAKQLKSLRKNSQKRPLKAQSYAKTLSAEVHEKDTRMNTKPIRRDTFNTNSAQMDVNKVKRFNEMCLSFPQIFPSKLDTSTTLTSRENDCNKFDKTQPDKTQPFPLPQISGTSLLHHSKANSDSITDVINNYQISPNSIQVRAENCTSASAFGKNNPENLKVLARSLLQKQQMCTRCGGITELTGIPNKLVDNTKSNGIDFEDKTSPRSCTHTHDVESRNLDFDSKMQQELSVCAKLDKSRYDSWAKPQRKEDREETETNTNNFDNKKTVNISYQDKHIKLKCEVTVNDCKDVNEASRNKSKESPRIKEIATARHRENMECPIKKETRIYGAKTKHLYSIGDGNENESEIQQLEAAAPSPYLEYCRRREKMKANKQDSFHEDFANIISDTSLPDLAGKVRKSKRRKLPVIPKKRSNNELKREHSTESKLLKSKSSVTKVIENNNERKEDSLVVTQCSLPKLVRK